MKRVLFVQRSVNPPGGGNAIAAWMLQALTPDHDVTLLCSEPPRWDDINAYYGTALGADLPRVRLVNRTLARLPLQLGASPAPRRSRQQAT